MPLMSPRASNAAQSKPISKRDARTILARFKSAGTWPLSKAVYLGRREIGTLATLLLFAALTLTFGVVANEMSAGKTRAFDTAVVMALRSDANPSDPLGPFWFEGAVRDITSLGSNAVLAVVTLATVGFLALSGARGAAAHVLVSVGSGAVLIQVLKELFGRVRPEVVPHAVSEVTRSFPSGHATLAAVTYLTLGALVARVQTKPALKMYVLFIAILLTLLVGISRVYLGVHWPTDVLAGWCLGAAWAIACWLVAVQLQRKGQIEKRISA
jgi:undecaprenyl-diphosphatase